MDIDVFKRKIVEDEAFRDAFFYLFLDTCSPLITEKLYSNTPTDVLRFAGLREALGYLFEHVKDTEIVKRRKKPNTDNKPNDYSAAI